MLSVTFIRFYDSPDFGLSSESFVCLNRAPLLKSKDAHQYNKARSLRKDMASSRTSVDKWTERDVILWLHTLCEEDNKESWKVSACREYRLPFLSFSLEVPRSTIFLSPFDTLTSRYAIIYINRLL